MKKKNELTNFIHILNVQAIDIFFLGAFCLYVQEHSYIVALSRLVPTSCTPRNNIIIGLAPDQPKDG